MDKVFDRREMSFTVYTETRTNSYYFICYSRQLVYAYIMDV
jgi:hypothetical protein